MSTILLKGFPEDLHRKAKAEAAMMGISMKELIIRAIKEFLNKKEKGG
ncbi:MAG: toxin-antitoxin system HicB family antitoxin [Deltaproteobacteria bacterium]|nr:toxin-antitoxin system HicB family antitoxin [Deltaproteobacteria bacterium]